MMSLAGGRQACSDELTRHWRKMGKKKKSMENSEVFSPAWHHCQGFIESEMRTLLFWDATVTAGWQMAFTALSGKHRERDNGYEIKVSQMCESIQTKVTNCQFKLKYSATTTKTAGRNVILWWYNHPIQSLHSCTQWVEMLHWSRGSFGMKDHHLALQEAYWHRSFKKSIKWIPIMSMQTSVAPFLGI